MVAVVGVSTLVLAGCTADMKSVVGVTLDEHGRVTAAVAVCKGQIDVLELTDTTDGLEESELLRSWTLAAEEGLTLVPLVEDGSGAPSAQLDLGDGRDFSLAGYGGESAGANRWFSPGPFFRAVDLDTLEPGQVLWESSALARTDVTDFEDTACTYLRDEVYGPDT